MQLLKGDTSIKTLFVSSYELLSCDISEATEFYNTELEWDTVIHFQCVRIQFEDVPHLSPIDRRKLQIHWYQKLITEIPTYLYFLTPEQFAEVLLSFSIKTNGIDFVEHLTKVNLTEEMVNYIVESLEDFHLLDLAPVSLVETILCELEKYIESDNSSLDSATTVCAYEHTTFYDEVRIP